MEYTNSKQPVSRPRSSKKKFSSKKKTGLSMHTLKLMMKKASLEQQEAKEYDLFINNGTFTTVGATSQLNAPIEGTDYNQRIGRKVRHHYLMLDITIQAGITQGPNDAGQISVVLDRQPNGSVAAFSDIYDTSSAVAGSAFRNTAVNSERFLVLKTGQYIIGGTTGVDPGTTPTIVKQRWFIPLHRFRNPGDQHAVFNTSNTGTCTSNAILIAYGGNIVASGTTTPTMTFNSRYRYFDA